MDIKMQVIIRYDYLYRSLSMRLFKDEKPGDVSCVFYSIPLEPKGEGSGIEAVTTLIHQEQIIGLDGESETEVRSMGNIIEARGLMRHPNAYLIDWLAQAGSIEDLFAQLELGDYATFHQEVVSEMNQDIDADSPSSAGNASRPADSIQVQEKEAFLWLKSNNAQKIVQEHLHGENILNVVFWWYAGKELNKSE